MTLSTRSLSPRYLVPETTTYLIRGVIFFLLFEGHFGDKCEFLVSSNKDEVPGKSDTYFDKASEIMASLTYATQLVNIIAFYSSTCLPYKVKFR